MVKSRKYVVKQYFERAPKREDYEIVEYELPPIQDREILVKTEWVSVDPYLRACNNKYTLPYDQFSFQIGLIEESKHPLYPVGTRVLSFEGWCEYSIINVSAPKSGFESVYKLPDLNGLSPSLGIGAAGMIGATAYFGFLEICKPKVGETVVVAAAAGGVGSLVGQIAKIKGCRVIGFTGLNDKVNWLEQELGFDRAFNYKTVDVQKALEKAAPNGIDCYFDNVGGEISSIIINQMNDFGRVSVCGSIIAYNVMTNLRKCTILQSDIVSKQLTIEDFVLFRRKYRLSEAFTEMIKWIKSGELKTREHITEVLIIFVMNL